VAVSVGLPVVDGSHCSPCVPVLSTTPSPHFAFLQVLRQSSWLFALPSSHCSPGSRMPLPQPSPDRQSELQPSPLAVLPSSQTSPTWTSLMPLPQTSVDLHG